MTRADGAAVPGPPKNNPTDTNLLRVIDLISVEIIMGL